MATWSIPRRMASPELGVLGVSERSGYCYYHCLEGGESQRRLSTGQPTGQTASDCLPVHLPSPGRSMASLLARVATGLRTPLRQASGGLFCAQRTRSSASSGILLGCSDIEQSKIEPVPIRLQRIRLGSRLAAIPSICQNGLGDTREDVQCVKPSSKQSAKN